MRITSYRKATLGAVCLALAPFFSAYSGLLVGYHGAHGDAGVLVPVIAFLVSPLLSLSGMFLCMYSAECIRGASAA